MLTTTTTKLLIPLEYHMNPIGKILNIWEQISILHQIQTKYEQKSKKEQK